MCDTIFVCYVVGSNGMNIIIVHEHFTVPTIRFGLLCDPGNEDI